MSGFGEIPYISHQGRRPPEQAIYTEPHGSWKHGHNRRGARSKVYSAWRAMLDRCNNPNVKSYVDYGAKGIRVCKRWAKFEHFATDMGLRPEGATLERINVRKSYTPSNCRWASRVEQAQNTRRNTINVIEAGQIRWLILDGGFKARQIAEAFNCHVDTVYAIKTGRQWRNAWENL